MNARGPLRRCPMCDSAESSPRADIERGGRRYAIVRCSGCGFVFVANPTGTTFDHVQDAPARVPEKPRHRQIKRVCDDALRRRGAHAGLLSVVEVGAGWGGLAQVFSRDPRYRYTGYEPSAARAAYGRARGFDVREGLFEPGSCGDSVDAFVFDNVLEHVEDPRALVRAAAASLRAGGVLVVIVPNLHDLRRFLPAWRDRHYWQPHCHINYFSRADLVRLLAPHGMKPRFFGFEAVGGLRDDLGLLPRVLADRVGLHVLGLNTYGVKPGTP